MHEGCGEDVSGVSRGGGEGVRRRRTDRGTVRRRWTMRGGVQSTHTHIRRRETVAQPGEMRAHLLFGRQGRQHHLARSSIPRKRVSLRRSALWYSSQNNGALPAGESLPLSKTHLRLPSSDSRRVHQSPLKFQRTTTTTEASPHRLLQRLTFIEAHHNRDRSPSENRN